MGKGIISGCVIMNKEDKLAITKDGMGKWVFPHDYGGPGEELLEVALRGLEKTGIDDLKILAQLEAYERKAVDKLHDVHMFVFETEDTELKSNSKWVTLDEANDQLFFKEDIEFYQGLKKRLEILAKVNKQIKKNK